MQELAQGIYYEPSFRGVNLGLIQSEDGVALFDTPMLPPVALAWRESVERYGPIRYVINSDHLQEHVMGNAFMPGDIIAHEETRARMRMTDKAREQYRKFVLDNAPDAAPLMDRYELRFPNITLMDRLTIYLGERRLEFLHLPGHTPNGIGLYLPEERLLFAGDVAFNNYRPYLGLSTIGEWQNTLRRIAELDVERIIPGHGEPMAPDQLEALGAHLVLTRDRVQELIDAGRARDEAVSKMMPYFEEMPIDNTRRDEERNLFRQGIRQLYDQLTGRK